MNLWQRLLDHVDRQHPGMTSWRDRLRTHDAILSELESIKEEVHTINQQLATGNWIEDMITGAHEDPTR